MQKIEKKLDTNYIRQTKSVIAVIIKLMKQQIFSVHYKIKRNICINVIHVLE